MFCSVTMHACVPVTVTSCGEDIQIPDRPQVEQLTGIFVSSYKLPLYDTFTLCESTITKLPPEARYVKFDVIFGPPETVEIDWQFGDEKLTILPVSFLVAARNQQVTMRYESEVDVLTGEGEMVSFVIRFQGQHQELF